MNVRISPKGIFLQWIRKIYTKSHLINKTQLISHIKNSAKSKTLWPLCLLNPCVFFSLLHPTLLLYLFSFSPMLQFVSFFSPFTVCFALIYMIQTSIAFLSKKKTLPSLAFDHLSGALIIFEEVCVHPSGPDRMSCHRTTKQKLVALNANRGSVAWKAAHFQFNNGASMDNHWLSNAARISIAHSLLLFMHYLATRICTDAIMSSLHIHIYVFVCGFYRNYFMHIMCQSLYSYFQLHTIRVFIHLLNYMKDLCCWITPRSAKIWIWIWALRWLMKPSRHWKWVTHSPAADENPYYWPSLHCKRFIWASHGPRATVRSNVWNLVQPVKNMCISQPVFITVNVKSLFAFSTFLVIMSMIVFTSFMQM